MPHKGPHISISPDYVVNRILRINIDDFAEWPESVRNLAIAIAEELFLVAYNPFINAETVRTSVRESYDKESVSLAHYYATAISEGLTMFWSAHEAETAFRAKLVDALHGVLPDECILTNPAAMVESATDATDLRMPCVLYFPGCGGALFYDRIGVSSIMLLLKAGFAVAVPPRHMCCGFPLLAAGMDTAFEDNMAQNRQYLASMLRNLAKQGFDCKHLVTACGSCRDGLERLHMLRLDLSKL